MYRASKNAHLYAAYGRGFETPTFAELAYRPDGAGLQFELNAARSNDAEFGAKFRFGRATQAQTAVFDSENSNELIGQSHSGGRTTYGNSGHTRRQGAEAVLMTQVDAEWHTRHGNTTEREK